MYESHYNIFKKHYGENIKLLMTDTDSFIYEIKTEDVYSDMYDMKEFYDLSNYSKDFTIKGGVNAGKKLFDKTNQKVLGKFKDELGGKPMSEFIGLKSKMYAFSKNDGSEKKVGKGIKKGVLNRDIKFNNYKDAIFKEDKCVQYHKMSGIVSKNHKIYAQEQIKRGISSYDDKRYYLEDGINSNAYGHFRINK